MSERIVDWRLSPQEIRLSKIESMAPQEEKSQVRVTVVMPVFNAAEYLPDALDSLLAQTFQDFEIIAVDDGSADGSGDILERYAARDPRVRVLHQQNVGSGAARNNALTVAGGRYIAQHDADDISAPGRLERQAAFLDEHPDVCAVYCRTVMADERLNPLYTILTPEDDAVIRRALPHGNILSGNYMMRRETLDEVGGYRPAFTYSQDYDLNLRVTEAGKVHCLPEGLYIVRKHPGQISIAKRHLQDEYGTLVKVFALERKKLGRDSYDRFAAAGDFQRFIDSYRFRREFYLFAGERTLRRLDVKPARSYLRRAFAQRPLSGRAAALLAISYVPRFILQGVRSLKNRFIDRLGKTAPTSNHPLKEPAPFRERFEILYVAGTELFAGHGGSVHTWEVAAELARRGHRVTLIAARTRRERHERVPPRNLTVVEVNMHIGGVIVPLRALRAARRACREKPDVIIERLAIPGGAGAILSRKMNIPLALDVNGPAPHFDMVLKRHAIARLPPARHLLSWWFRTQYRRSSLVFTANPSSIPAWFDGRVEVLDLGVAINKFTPDLRDSEKTAQLKKDLGLNGKFVVFYAGAFMNWQGFNVLPEAIEAACKDDRVMFLLAGQGDEYESFRSRIDTLGLGSRVVLPGAVSPEDLPLYAACADVGIAPYQPPEGKDEFYFGSPLKVFEYMAAGLPVVTTDCPPLPDIIKEGESGTIVPPHDGGALGRAILELAAEPQRAAEMGRRNRDIAIGKYSWKRHVDRLEALLLDVTAKQTGT